MNRRRKGILTLGKKEKEWRRSTWRKEREGVAQTHYFFELFIFLVWLDRIVLRSVRTARVGDSCTLRSKEAYSSYSSSNNRTDHTLFC